MHESTLILTIAYVQTKYCGQIGVIFKLHLRHPYYRCAYSVKFSNGDVQVQAHRYEGGGPMFVFVLFFFDAYGNDLLDRFVSCLAQMHA